MAINEVELADRLARIRERMHEENFNALIIYSDEYRSGNTTSVSYTHLTLPTKA